MLKLNIKDETSRLRSVILGTSEDNGPTPYFEHAYDPKSIEHIQAKTYPVESEMIIEMDEFNKVLQKYDVTVYRPEVIIDENQIFARDIAFVIGDTFIEANVLPQRDREFPAIRHVVGLLDPAKTVSIPDKEIHIEGGDVMLWNDHIFIGTYKGTDYSKINTARTNMRGVDFIKNLFPNKIVKEFDLVKSATQARNNALHLDCCFQPVGKDKAIIYKGGFRDESEYAFLVGLFDKENLFHVTQDEMYHMYCNIFSISEEIVVSEKNFIRLNTWLRKQGLTVEEIPYSEISKQGGLLRCSTLPLIRD